MGNRAGGFRDLRGSGFFRILGAQGFSSAAEYTLESLTKLVVATVLPGAAASLGLSAVSILAVVPRVLLSKIAGSVADSSDRPRLLFFSALVRCVIGFCLLALAFFVYQDSPLFAVSLLGLAFVTTCVSQFFNTARYSLAHSVIPAGSRPEAASLSLFSLTGIGIVITAAVPALYSWLGFDRVVIAAIACEVFALLLVASRVNKDRPGRFVLPSPARVDRSSAALVTVLRRYPITQLILTLSCGYSFCSGFVNVSLPLFILRYHGIPMYSYGLITSAFAMGGLLGGLFAWKLIKLVGAFPVLIGAGVFAGVGYVALSLLGSVPLLSFAMLGVGACVSCFSVAQGPLLQGGVPNRQIGLAYGVINGISALFLICGAVLAGLMPSVISWSVEDVVSWFSYPLLIFVGGLSLLLVCLFCSWKLHTRFSESSD